MRPEALDHRPSPGNGNPLLAPAVKALLGVICLLALMALGLLARTAMVTRHDLHVDQKAEALRSPFATSLSLAATSAASEAVGIAVLVLAVIALVVRRRRWDAARLLAAVGASWTLGIAVKLLIDRARPPASLWLLKPDSVDSFPSGHTTTACAMIVIALVVFRGWPILRVVATSLAVALAIAVGASRIYLGDHYPTDVLGSSLTVAAAALLVWAVTDLRPLQRLGTRVLKDPRPATRLA